MPRQYFFWKYFNTIIVLYCIIVQKNPIFVQLSPIQCTYSNIFIRFFKFFPANTIIYQNSYRVPGANCAVEIALSGRQCSLLCLFAPFSPRKYKSILRGVLYGSPSGRLPRRVAPRNDIKCVARNCIKCVRNFCFYRVLRRNLAFFTTVANYSGFVCGF